MPSVCLVRLLEAVEENEWDSVTQSLPGNILAEVSVIHECDDVSDDGCVQMERRFRPIDSCSSITGYFVLICIVCPCLL